MQRRWKPLQSLQCFVRSSFFQFSNSLFTLPFFNEILKSIHKEEIIGIFMCVCQFWKVYRRKNMSRIGSILYDNKTGKVCAGRVTLIECIKDDQKDCNQHLSVVGVVWTVLPTHSQFFCYTSVPRVGVGTLVIEYTLSSVNRCTSLFLHYRRTRKRKYPPFDKILYHNEK